VPAYLLMNAGLRAGSRYRLDENSVNLLGRDWDCRVVLNDPQCSRVHAAIAFEDGAWWIRDRQSSNGTWVNGQRADTAQLAEGTQIRIGGSAFTFSTAPAETGRTETPAGASPDEPATAQTIVLEEQLNPGDTGEHTLEFLREYRSGGDFFFLFQLSVKLLSIEDPDEVVAVCVERLHEGTSASVSGFMWLSDRGQLKPKVVLPGDSPGTLALDDRLTERVVRDRKVIRIEHGTTDGSGGDRADSICIPVLNNDEAIGALHLYRNRSFDDSHFRLAVSVANLMSRSLARANRQAVLAADNQRLKLAAADDGELIGESPVMQQLRSKISRIARAHGSVLIRGESGSGKELVARALHRSGNRSHRPMLSVNCAAIPRDLMESQLFGHRKGSFTSADRDHAGWFQQADLGTLFLDEIGELTLEGQAKLLRILEGHPFLPVGGTEEITVDVRVICATNRDLRDVVAAGRFREDLYYRLSVFELEIPPLRERGADIELLLNHFFEHFRIRHGRPGLQLGEEARQKLLSFAWPGNVRQLRNVIDSAVVLADNDIITPDDLGIRDARSDEPESLEIAWWERKLIRMALERTRDNVPAAAALLGISRATLYRKIEEYGFRRDNDDRQGAMPSGQG
jgi:Nif-specific regulatory protein